MDERMLQNAIVELRKATCRVMLLITRTTWRHFCTIFSALFLLLRNYVKRRINYHSRFDDDKMFHVTFDDVDIQ